VVKVLEVMVGVVKVVLIVVQLHAVIHVIIIAMVHVQQLVLQDVVVGVCDDN